MKKFLIAAAALAFVATAAEAKCTKKSLNGTWSLGFAGIGGIGTMSGGAIIVPISATSISFTLTSFSSTKCRGSGTGLFDGTPVTVKVASEKIPSTAESPNHLFVTMVAGATTYQISMQRQ